MAATALAAPLVIPSTAWGDGQTPPPSNRIALGHIGVGNRGRALFRDFQNCKDAQSVAVADCYQDRREAYAELCGGRPNADLHDKLKNPPKSFAPCRSHANAYADFRDLLARKDIDAVVIATPDHWHVPLALAAARAGKDAYVEKPLGVSVEQDLVCRKVFQERKRIFQYGTQQRSSSHCRFGCELVRSGRIGKLHTIEVIAPDGGAGGSTKEIPVPAGLDFEMWTGPAPVKPYTADRCHPPGTYWIYDYSIGYLGGWGAHPLDIMVWGSDADLAGPMVFEGTGQIPGTGLYDTVFHWDVKIQMGGGVNMTFKPGSDCTKFIGSDGWVEIRRRGLDAEPKSLLTSVIGPGDVHLITSPHHAKNFVAAVKSRTAAVSNLPDAVRSDLISQLSNIAVRLKRKITWDPRREVIVGDAEASKLTRRAMRSPWTL
jgi:hypothetical protein